MTHRPFTLMHAVASFLLAFILTLGWASGLPINKAAYPVLILFLLAGALIAFNLSRVPFDRKDQP